MVLAERSVAMGPVRRDTTLVMRSDNVIEVGGLRAAYSLAQRKGSGDWFAIGTVSNVHASREERGFWMVTANGTTPESAVESLTQELQRQAMASIH